MQAAQRGLAMGALLVLTACAPADSPQAPKAAASRATSVAAVTDAPGVIRGRYTWGHELRVLQPCGSAETLWVSGEPHVVGPLHERARAAAIKHNVPHQHVYIEVHGAFDDRPDEGFAADFDGRLHVDHIVRMDSTIPADCGPPPPVVAPDGA